MKLQSVLVSDSDDFNLCREYCLICIITGSSAKNFVEVLVKVILSYSSPPTAFLFFHTTNGFECIKLTYNKYSSFH